MQLTNEEMARDQQSQKRFVSHPMIKPSSLEERRYQVDLAAISGKQNTLAVLPTGLGKTAIALLIISDFLAKNPSSRCLILAPTRVLVHQHHSFLSDHLLLSREEIGVLTGEDTVVERGDIWSKRLVCATPQVLVSDIRRKNCAVEGFSLIVFDEVHRAVGNHAYCSIAAIYNELRTDGRIVGMTASLPSDKTKVDEIVQKLKIQKVEIRDEKSEDVRPYVFKTGVDFLEVELSPPLKEIQRLMKDALNSRLRLLEEASLVKHNRYGSVALKDLLALRTKVDQIQSSELKSALFSSIRLIHALNLVETQSLAAFKAFMDRLADRKRGYGMNELLSDSRVAGAFVRARDALEQGTEHPKIEQVLKLAERVKSGERAIVFASYRDSVDQIYSQLIKHGFKAGYLIGKSGESGQSQKKQIRALQELRDGVYDILVATQVGEEGLDVAECNLVIFYDNVPSAVRFVQRKGRTGRKKEGHIYVLIAKGTKDEAYYWLSRRRMGEMRKIASALTFDKAKGGPMDHFIREGRAENRPTVFVDSREQAEFVSRLRHKGALVEVKQLDIGDFVVSSEIVIERKTLDDFVKSIYDGRLFKQLVNMTSKYKRPILIIQGDRRGASGIGESAFYGALASVVSDFRVPIFFAADEKELTELVFHIARREQLEKKREIQIREGRKPVTLSDTQRYIVSGIPGVSAILADRLLTKMESVERLFSAEEGDLRSVEGIGDVMAARIRKFSTAKYVPLRPSESNEASNERSQFSLDETKEENKASDADAEIPPPPSDD